MMNLHKEVVEALGLHAEGVPDSDIAYTEEFELLPMETVAAYFTILMSKVESHVKHAHMTFYRTYQPFATDVDRGRMWIEWHAVQVWNMYLLSGYDLKEKALTEKLEVIRAEASSGDATDLRNDGI
jgi:hypothetical protein